MGVVKREREEQKDQNELSFVQIAVGVIPAITPTGFPSVFLYGLAPNGKVYGYEPNHCRRSHAAHCANPCDGYVSRKCSVLHRQ